MNEVLTRSITGILFVALVICATTYGVFTATILWGAVVFQGLREYKKLNGSVLGYLFIALAVISTWAMGRPFDAFYGFISDYRGWDVVAFLTWIWANDTFAYIGGRMLGREIIKRGLAPQISPNKSWEGAFIGAIGAAFVGWLWMGGEGAVLGLLTGVLSTCGDLVESSYKRRAGVKDSGSLLPGHGGILDRFDGLLIAAPVVLIIKLFIIS